MKTIVGGKGTTDAQKAQQAAMQHEQERQHKLLQKPTELMDEKCVACNGIIWHQTYVLKEIPPKEGSPAHVKAIPVPKPVFICAGCGQLHPSAVTFVHPSNTIKA